MIIHLHKYDWDVVFLDDVCPKNISSLVDALEHAGCPDGEIDEVMRVFTRPNRGCIYTNNGRRVSVVAIGWCTSWKQEVNTIAHEIHHLAEHICRACDLPTDGEPPAYMVNYILDHVFDMPVNTGNHPM